jgi:hypothetical protein
MPEYLDQYIAGLQTPDTATRNYLLSNMTSGTASGMAALENLAGQRGWGSRSGVYGGAASNVYQGGLQSLMGGLVSAEQMRFNALGPAVMAHAELEQRERERKSQWLASLMGGIGGGLGSIGGALLTTPGPTATPPAPGGTASFANVGAGYSTPGAVYGAPNPYISQPPY